MIHVLCHAALKEVDNSSAPNSYTKIKIKFDVVCIHSYYRKNTHTQQSLGVEIFLGNFVCRLTIKLFHKGALSCQRPGTTRCLVAQNQTSQLRRNKIALIHASLQ